MSEILNENLETEIPVEETIPQRVNPFCVISKQTFGEYNVHDIQTNGSWGANPYEDYAVVPDDMVNEIMETRGFCDIVLNKEETEVVSFTAREIPEIPEPPHEPTLEEEIQQLKEYDTELLYQVCLLQLGITEDEMM